MKHDFIDKYGTLSSPLHRLDPRVKIVCLFLAIVVIASEPLTSAIVPFLLYLVVVVSLTLISGVPFRYVIVRLLVASPFIVVAALFFSFTLYLTGGDGGPGSPETFIMPGVVIFSRAVLSVWLLILLTSTERFRRLLEGMRGLRLPPAVTTISALLYRYLFIIYDEVLRTTRARESRTPGRLRINRFRVYGNQLALIFIRSWDRSHTVYRSMLSRGFKGDFPGMQRLEAGWNDLVFAPLFLSVMIIIRIRAWERLI